MSPAINANDMQCQAITRGARCPNRAVGIKDVRYGNDRINAWLCSEHMGRRTGNFARRQLWSPPAPPAPVPVQPQTVTVAPAVESRNGNATTASAAPTTSTLAPAPTARRAPRPAPAPTPAPSAPADGPICFACARSGDLEILHVDHEGEECPESAKCFFTCTTCVRNAAHLVTPKVPPVEKVELPPASLRYLGDEAKLAAKRERHKVLMKEFQSKVVERLEAMRKDHEIKELVDRLVFLMSPEAGDDQLADPAHLLDLFGVSGIPPSEVHARERLYGPWVDLVIKNEYATGEGETVEVTDQMRDGWINAAYEGTSDNGFFRRLASTKKVFRERIYAARKKYLATAEVQAEDRAAELAELRAAAAPVLNDPIGAIETEFPRIGLGGDVGPAMALVAAEETRLLKLRGDTLVGHTQIVAASGAGKTFLMSRSKALLSPDCYIELNVSSPMMMVYDDREYQYKVLFMNELSGQPGARQRTGDDQDTSAVIIRELLSENRFKYETTVKDDESPNGRKVVSIEKDGPSVLIAATVQQVRTTSELGTRLGTVTVPESWEQVAAALEAQADAEDRGGFLSPSPAILALRLLRQRQAEAAGGFDVYVPFARVFNRLLHRRRQDNRLMRDAARLRSLIKGVTILRLEQRQRDTQGRYISTLDDYRKVFEWCSPDYEAGVIGVNPDIREMVEVLAELTESAIDTATVRQISAKLNEHRRSRGDSREIPKRQVQRWLDKAVELGYVVDKADPYRKLTSRAAGMYKVGDELPPATALPTPEEIAEELSHGAQEVRGSCISA